MRQGGHGKMPRLAHTASINAARQEATHAAQHRRWASRALRGHSLQGTDRSGTCKVSLRQHTPGVRLHVTLRAGGGGGGGTATKKSRETATAGGAWTQKKGNTYRTCFLRRI